MKNYKVNIWNMYIHFVFNFRSLFTILLICLIVYLFFFLLLRASLQSFPPYQRLSHSSLLKRGQVRDLKVGWNFYRQVCLYGYKFHVENKLKKKQHKYVVVKEVGWWIIREINCEGYLSFSLTHWWLGSSWIRELIVEVTYLSHWSISAIFKYIFPTICKM